MEGKTQGGTHIKKIGGKWRIMDKSGQGILHAGNDPANKPMDGGGYANYADALSAFRGMQMHRHGG